MSVLKGVFDAEVMGGDVVLRVSMSALVKMERRSSAQGPGFQFYSFRSIGSGRVKRRLEAVVALHLWTAPLAHSLLSRYKKCCVVQDSLPVRQFRQISLSCGSGDALRETC